MLRLDLVQFLLGAQVDGAEPLALAADAVELLLGLGDLRQSASGLISASSAAPPARYRKSRGFRARCRRAGAWRHRGAPRRAPLRRGPRRPLPVRRARPCRLRRVRSRLRPAGRRRRGARPSAVSISPIRPARFGEFLRRIFQFVALGLRLGAALADGDDLRRGAFLALAPGGPLGGDRLQPAICEFGFAGDGLRLDPHLGAGAAFAGDRSLTRSASLRGRRPAAARRALSRLRRGSYCFVAACADARLRLRERRDARRIAADFALGRSVLVACRIGQALRLAPAARACVSAAAAAASAASASRPHAAALDLVARRCKFALDGLQAAALGKPACRAGRRMRRDQSRPSAKIAFARHQPLAGLEHLRQARAVGALDDANLREPPRQLRRALHESESAAAPSGRAGSVGSLAAPAQRIGAESPTGASRSSPSAAPKAFS